MSKRVAIVAFTASGKERIEELKEAFVRISRESGEEWIVNETFKPGALKGWCLDAFTKNDALIFVSALGIAVRTIAPFLVKKTVDPAVLVMDDMGENIISVLSGHIGGANELTLELSKHLGAHPVITTSSDVHGKLAVDSWAVKNNLVLTDMEAAKKVAMEIVEGRKVGLYCDCEIKGQVPPELVLLDGENDASGINWCIVVSDRKLTSVPAFSRELNIMWLIPKVNVLGIGCKKGKAMGDIRDGVEGVLKDAGIDIRSVTSIASIDLKAREEGLLAFAESLDVPANFYSEEDLKNVPGKFEFSGFVQDITGVDNVCERAAVKEVRKTDPEADRETCLIVSKKKCDGVTVAVAAKKGCISFE